MTRKLQPPKRFRTVIPHICATCRYLLNDGDGSFLCQRAPDVVTFDIGDRNDIISTCNGWRSGMSFGPDAFTPEEA